MDRTDVDEIERSLWSKTWQTLGATAVPSAFVLGLLVFIPHILCALLLNLKGLEQTAFVIQFGNGAKLSLSQTTPNLASFLDVMRGFIGPYATVQGILIFLTLVAYFSLLGIMVEYYAARSIPSFWTLLAKGFWNALLRGIGIFLAMVLLLTMAQLIFPPLVLVVLPVVFAPVLVVREKRRAVPALFYALTYRFLGVQKSPGWSRMFQIWTVGAACYCFFFGAGYVSTLTMNALQFFSEAHEIASFRDLPLHYFLAELIWIFTLSIAVFASASLTVTFVELMRHGQRGGMKVYR